MGAKCCLYNFGKHYFNKFGDICLQCIIKHGMYKEMWMAISVLVLFFSCGKDPILQKAESLDEEKPQKRTRIADEKRKGLTEKEKRIAHTEKEHVVKKGEAPEPKDHVVKSGDPPLPKEHIEKSGDPDPQDPLGSGPKIEISGEIKVKNWSQKPIRINVFDGDHQKGEKAQIVISEWVKTPGKFSLQIPKSEKSIWLEANIDEDEDGKPGPKDPIAWYSKNPLTANQNYQDIVLSLEVFVEPN